MKNIFYTIILVCSIFNGFAQNVNSTILDPILNNTIITNENSSEFGSSISFSTDGSVLAIGENKFTYSDNLLTGRVQVYENLSGLWIQKGQDIFGIDDLYNTFGTKVVLSSDGNTLAVYDAQVNFTLSPGQTLEDLLGDTFSQYFRYIQVYNFTNGNWVQVGNDLLVNQNSTNSDFALSGDGNTLAITKSGGTEIFVLNGSNWTQIGQDLLFEDNLGQDYLSLSEDGNTIIIGDPGYSDPNSPPGNDIFIGQVKVYQITSNTWTQIGNTIIGTTPNQNFGAYVDISANGNTIAVVSRQGGVDDFASTFELVAGNWQSKGSQISQGIGEILSLDMSSDGSALAVVDDNGARVFKFNTDWEQVNRTVDVEGVNDYGEAIAIADSGDLFAVGTPFIQTGGNNGFVNIYGTNPNVNLLFNGSAEILPVIGNGWTQTTGITTAVEASGTSTPAQDGDYFFYANQSDPAEFFQDVDLTSFASEIDSGNKSFKFSGYIRSFNQGNPDQGRAVLEYKDVNGVVLDTYDTGLIASIDLWFLFEDTRIVPIGTRSATVTLFQQLNSGTNNDGYLDDLILQETPGLPIPDPNFELALIGLNIDSDGIINGEISASDPIGVIDLDLNSKNIVNLLGIQYFTDLETLNASSNNLITLDLTENIALVSANLNNNQLEDIDVADLLLLEDLSISGNIVTNLELATNSSLEFLDASNNNLENLDIRNGNNLNIPSANFNALNNPDLICIAVDDENYSSTTWLNVSPQVSFALNCTAFNPNNLLFNGSAEITPVIGNGWSQESGNTTGAPKVPPFDGINLFYGNQTSFSEFYQDVDLTFFASAIDTGNKAFRFSTYFNSFNQPNPDESRALLEYKDSNDQVLDSYDTGYIASVDAWTLFEDIRIAPVGTRSVRVTLFQKRNTGSNNDGYIDAVAFEEAPTTFTIIPDPNFELHLISQGIDSDGIINAQMQASDAIGETSLIMNNLNISDLTGIEAFTDLEILTAVDNNLATIDISQNTALTSVILTLNSLTSIDVSNNTNLSTLNLTANNVSSLDLSNNTALSILDLSGNVLTSLDTSNLTNLTQFRANNNLLTALDLSSNINLIQVACASNDLMEFNMKNGFNNLINNTFFDATNNPNLTCIQVDDVTYSENTWTSVDSQTDFSTNCDATFINIPDPNFEQALISLNIDSDQIVNGQMMESDALGVTDLDVSSQNISDLTGIEFFTDLQILSAFDNNLSSIDITQNTQLTSAVLALNNLSSVDLSSNPSLVSISLNDNNLTTLNLTGNPNLVQVFVNNNNLNSIDVSVLPILENLGVAGNNIIVLDTAQNQSLTSLFCNDNQLNTLSVQNGNNVNLTNFETQNNPNLTCIEVDDVSYSNTNWLNAQPQFNFDAQMFFSLNCSTLINIPDPNFEQALVDAFIDSDQMVNGTISEADALNTVSLNVNSKNISDLTGIEFFTNLDTLFALDNNLSTVDLSANAALEILVLSLNNLTQIDLTNNLNLSSLSLASNQLTALDVSNNSGLTQLYVGSNNLSVLDVSSLTLLAELEVSLNQLVELDLSQNPALNQIYVNDNNLVNLNVKNGNNSTITNNFFNATNNSNLFCIEVDDENYSTSTWTNLDAQSSFGEDCAPSNDDCSDAQSITLGQDVPSTTQSSTSSGNVPGCQEAGLILVDVWFQFVAPASGSVTLTLDAAPFTLKSALYENCTDLMPIACGENGLQVDNLTPGQTYYVQTWVEADLTGLLPQSNLTEVGDFTIKVDDTSTLSTFAFNNFEASFKMFPNPAQNYVTLDANQPINGFEIYSINGQKVLSQSNLNSQNHSVDVSMLSKGIYLIKVSSENSTLTQKLIIR